MRIVKIAISAFFACVLSACATGYGSSGPTGGYTDFHVAEDVYRVRYAANGFSTRETAQTYWLYRAAELTIEKGFDGFEIVSPIQLGSIGAREGFQKAAFIYIPMPSNQRAHPLFEADIRLLKLPFKHSPPKIFEARVLKEALEPYVKAEKKCSDGNVCPHLKKYLQPVEPGKEI